MKDVHVLIDESSHKSWAELLDKPGGLQEHELRGYWKFVQFHSEVNNGTFWRNSECKMAGNFISILDEISNISWSSDQMGEGKSVNADSVFCVGQMNESEEAITRWEGQVQEFKMYLSYQEYQESMEKQFCELLPIPAIHRARAVARLRANCRCGWSSRLCRDDVLNCSHSESLMAAATAINAEAFTNQALTENNSANCLNAYVLEPIVKCALG